MAGTLLLLLATALPQLDELRQIPEVAAVTTNSVTSPTYRVVHLLNWHWIPRDRFKLDNPDGDYEKFLDEVDAIQQEQMKVLRAMKVRVVFYEGLTTENIAAYKRKIEQLRRLKQRKGDDPIDELVRSFVREDTLQLGAPGRLWLAGELDAVLPADDAKLLDAADPVKDGKVEFDEAAVRRREDAIVKLLLKQPESVVVLGGSHDLTSRLPTGVRYERLITRRYKQAIE